MKRPSLPKNFPDETVFIIDGLSAAYTVSLLCDGRPIRCIYECKDIQWRKADFVALYDLLLSDVDIIEKRIEYVPHPYFIQGRNLIETIRNQQAFIRDIRKRVSLDSSQTYCGCATSSILLGYKDVSSHILIDEGMESLMARHRLYSSDRTVWMDKIRKKLAGWLIPFRFHRDTPQITMARDAHDTIVLRKDYRDFRSHRFDDLAAPLLEHCKLSKYNILTLVNGPAHMSACPIAEQHDIFSTYVDFNIRAIKRFITLHPESADACFYLKTHPSLGLNSPLVTDLLSSLSSESISARNITQDMSFEELPSIPAEAYLATGKFNALLSIDASSTLWHVGHDPSLKCYMPLDDIIDLAGSGESAALLPLLVAQRELNRINGDHVTFY